MWTPGARAGGEGGLVAGPQLREPRARGEAGGLPGPGLREFATTAAPRGPLDPGLNSQSGNPRPQMQTPSKKS